MTRRRPSHSKQVSFVENSDNQQEKTSPKIVTIITGGDDPQPLALTTKNLNTYNAMILKTIRTSKFDERLVKLVNVY